MVSTEFKGIGLHYTAFRDAIREDSRQTTPSRGVTPRKRFAIEANVESRVNRRRLAEMPRADSRTRASRRDRPSPRWFRLLRCITPRGMTCHVLLTSARRRLRLPECAGRASCRARNRSIADKIEKGNRPPIGMAIGVARRSKDGTSLADDGRKHYAAIGWQCAQISIAGLRTWPWRFSSQRMKPVGTELITPY